MATAEKAIAEGFDVLVVDDDEGMRTLVAIMLTNAGLTVRTAEDGRKALQILQTARPKVVLLDLNMPVMNGWGTLEYIRAIPALKSIPVVTMSAHTQAPYPTGSDGAVEKPFAREALLWALRPYFGVLAR